MKLYLMAAVLLLVITAVPGCISGPSYLYRTVDDKQNELYAESPILSGVATDVVPIFPLIKVVAWIGDFAVLNPVQFWGYDVWSGEGATFQHKNPSSDKETFLLDVDMGYEL